MDAIIDAHAAHETLSRQALGSERVRDGTYVIPTRRLGETRGTGRNGEAVAEWLQHMADKTWVDVEDFATAFLVALPLHGVTAFTRTALAESLRLMRKVRDRASGW